jgi:hypothetical protein
MIAEKKRALATAATTEGANEKRQLAEKLAEQHRLDRSSSSSSVSTTTTEGTAHIQTSFYHSTHLVVFCLSFPYLLVLSPRILPFSSRALGYEPARLPRL